MRACRPTVEQCIPCGGDYPSVACGDSSPDKGSQGLSWLRRLVVRGMLLALVDGRTHRCAPTGDDCYLVLREEAAA